MKRFWQEAPANIPSPQVLDGSSPSLKRLRLSTSPGELRLEGDLQTMTTTSGGCWKHVDQRHWVCKRSGALLERQFGNPLNFILYLSQNLQVCIEISREGYPHVPPTITRVIHPLYQNGIVLVQPALTPYATYSHDSCATTLVYDQWCPVRRFQDLLVFLVNAMKRPPKGRNVITPTLDQDMYNDSMQDDYMEEEDTCLANVHEQLSPNRFDCGYPKHGTNIMPRGEKQTKLFNNSNY